MINQYLVSLTPRSINMTSIDEIIIIANKLANQGKKPTVALIKTQLSQPTPLPQIISVLKTWQHDPLFIKGKNIGPVTKASKESLNTLNVNDLQLIIEQALQPIKDELKEVKALLKSSRE